MYVRAVLCLYAWVSLTIFLVTIAYWASLLFASMVELLTTDMSLSPLLDGVLVLVLVLLGPGGRGEVGVVGRVPAPLDAQLAVPLCVRLGGPLLELVTDTESSGLIVSVSDSLEATELVGYMVVDVTGELNLLMHSLMFERQSTMLVLIIIAFPATSANWSVLLTATIVPTVVGHKP